MQSHAPLGRCQQVMVLIEKCLHRGGSLLVSSGGGEGSVDEGLARTFLIGSIQHDGPHTAFSNEGSSHASSHLVGGQNLSAVERIEVGRNVALLPMVAGSNSPCGLLATNAEIERVVCVEVIPPLVGRLRGVVVFVVRRAGYVIHGAEVLLLVLHLLVGVGEIEQVPRRTGLQ